MTRISVESVREAIRSARAITVPSRIYPGEPVVLEMGEASDAEAKALYEMAMAEAHGDQHEAAEIVRRHVGVGVA